MDLSLIKQKLAASQNKGQKREKTDYTKIFWKPKPGKHQVRILPSKFDKSNPFREVYFHYGFSKGPILALSNWGEKDPIVEFAQQLRKTSDKENWSLAKKLDPKMRVFAPVIVRGEEEKGVRLWEFGKEIYLQLLGIADDEDYGDYTDIQDGRDFTVEAVMGDIGGRQGLKSSIRIKPKVSPLSTNKTDIEKFLEEQPNILEIQSTYKMSFDKLKETLQNWLNPDAEEADVDAEDEDEETPFVEEPKKESNYKLKTKESKADKFDKLFEDED